MLQHFLKKFTTTRAAAVMFKIKTFVFLDLETTGLPYQEYNKTKITELCAVAVQADHIGLGTFPRVSNKLCLCCNPRKMIQPTASDITGLTNELLEHQPPFSCQTVNVIKNWLELHQKPICFVAHNGDRFDFPILRAEIDKTGTEFLDDILCIDSLSAFMNLDKEEVQSASVSEVDGSAIPIMFEDGFDELLLQACEDYEKSEAVGMINAQKVNETTPEKQKIRTPLTISNPPKRNCHRQVFQEKKSYKLQDMYTRLLSKPPVDAHEADGDVSMLIGCAAVYNDRFVNYANTHAKKFLTVPAMMPGRKIGT